MERGRGSNQTAGLRSVLGLGTVVSRSLGLPNPESRIFYIPNTLISLLVHNTYAILA